MSDIFIACAGAAAQRIAGKLSGLRRRDRSQTY